MKTTLLALVFVLAAGCRCAQPQPPTVAALPAPPPTTPEACQACNGQWGRHGLSQQEGCLCRTKDAGKVCKAKSDCESQCVAKDEPDTEIVEPGSPAKGFFLGKCHDFVAFFGCARLLTDRATTPVSLAELPPKLCVD